MSGFEVLGLACSIFQTISFAHETLNICTALYHNQEPLDANVEEVVSSMIVAAEKVTAICDKNKRLNDDIAQIVSGCKNDALGEEIARIAKKCTKIASQLKLEVAKITRLQGGRKLWNTTRVAFLSSLKKSKLEKLNENLCSYREQMQALLITQIW
jgi:GTP-binding protein EngB required for normal cell division